MDYSTALVTIEKACAEAQHPATRLEAEKVLLEFKNSPNIVPVCQYILEHSKQPQVQFHAASGITGAIVREYGLYQKQDIRNLQNYLVAYNLNHPGLVFWVSKQIYQAIAVISKRGWLEDSPEEQDVVFNSIMQLLSMGEEEKKVGLSLASALVDEFSSRGKASSVGLTWEFHHKTKLSFEERHLRLIFEASLRILLDQLQDLIAHPGQDVSGKQKPLLGLSIHLADSILQWDFASTNQRVLAGTFEDPENDTGRVITYPASWRSVLVNGDVLSMFFKLFPLVQDDNIMTHRVRQCLIQLCGLHGEIFANEESIRHHISGVMKGLLELIATVAALSSDECLQADYTDNLISITEMIRQLLSYHSIQMMCSVEDTFGFLSQVAQLTVHCLSEASKLPEESESVMDAFDQLLVTWVKLVHDAQAGLTDRNSHAAQHASRLLHFFHGVSYNIVEKYIDTRLELAQFIVTMDEEDDGFADWETYNDQLISIAALARLDPHRTLIRLQTLLHERIEGLKSFLKTNQDGSMPTHLVYLQEHLHWLIVITGYVFTDDNRSETAMVPETLNELSAGQGADQDQVVDIFTKLMGLLDAVSLDPISPQAISCSPQVSLSLFWFLERWTKTFLMINPENYAKLSPNLVGAYADSARGGHGQAILEFLVSKIRKNFIMWNADSDVLVQIIRVMTSFSLSSSARSALLKSDQFPPLIQFFIDHLSELPEVVHNSLIQSLAGIISYSPSEQMSAHYFSLISGTIESRFRNVQQNIHNSSQYQDAKVVEQVMNSLEMFDGLALAASDANTPLIFAFCSQYFESFVQLVQIYHSFPEVQILVLRLFTDMTKHFELATLSIDHVNYYHTCLMNLLQTFSAANLGVKRATAWEEADDEPYQDVSIVLELLLNVLEVFGVDQMLRQSPNSILPSTVVFSGVNILLPMIKENMLKIPRLCTAYIKLISKLVESYPARLIELPPELLSNLMMSLEFGMDNNVIEVAHMTYQAITAMALHAHNAAKGASAGTATIHNGGSNNSNAHLTALQPHLDRFLKLTFEHLLFKPFEIELVDVAGSCALALVCARHESYGQLIQELLAASETPLTPELQERLSSSFMHLQEAFPSQEHVLASNQAMAMRDVAMTAHRREVFMRFLMGVRGVLRVK
ncbi:Exportin-4 [Actinomortierella ambigua]|nr:Exportin-4 [Actinomortierella ambigua]